MDGELTTTKDYATTQGWAKWFFQCRDIDGLKYSSRPGGSDLINYVLFNRPGLKVALERNAGKTLPLIRWSARLAEACQALNVIVLPKPPPSGP